MGGCMRRGPAATNPGDWDATPASDCGQRAGAHRKAQRCTRRARHCMPSSGPIPAALSSAGGMPGTPPPQESKHTLKTRHTEAGAPTCSSSTLEARLRFSCCAALSCDARPLCWLRSAADSCRRHGRAPQKRARITQAALTGSQPAGARTSPPAVGSITHATLAWQAPCWRAPCWRPAPPTCDAFSHAFSTIALRPRAASRAVLASASSAWEAARREASAAASPCALVSAACRAAFSLPSLAASCRRQQSEAVRELRELRRA